MIEWSEKHFMGYAYYPSGDDIENTNEIKEQIIAYCLGYEVL